MAMTENPWKCDKCGRAKGEGNGWLIGIPIASDPFSEMKNGLIINGLDPAVGYTGYAIVSWDEAMAYRNARLIHHLCSEACALAKQGEYLRA